MLSDREGLIKKFWQDSPQISHIFGGVLLFACLAYFLLAIKTFIDMDVAFPVFDNWYYFADLCRYLDENDPISFLVKPANEHRPVLTFVAMLIDYRCFGFNLTFIKIFHLLSYGSLIGFILWLSGCITDKFDVSIKKPAKTLVYASGLFLITSMRQWEIHYGYTNVGTIQGYLFFLYSTYLYHKRCDARISRKKVSGATFFPILLFALLSTASMSFGLMTLPCLLLISILRGARKEESWFFLVLTGLLFSIYCIGMDFSPAHKTEWQFHLHDLLRILYFATILPGSILVADTRAALPMGLIGMMATALVSIVIIRKKPYHCSKVMTAYGLLLLTLAYMIMVGIGRRHMIDEQAMISRYMLTAGIYWQSLFTLSIYCALELFPGQKLRVLTIGRIAIVPVIIALLIQQKVKHDFLVRMAENNRVAITALQFSILDPDTFPDYQLINLEGFFSSLKVLSDHETSIYGTKTKKLYGKNIQDAYFIDNNLCTGNISGFNNLVIIKQLDPDVSMRGLKLCGTVQNRQTTTPPSSGIVLTDRGGTIKGSGLHSLTSSTTPFPPTMNPRWVAFARLELDTSDIYSYAVYEQNHSACLINVTTIPADSSGK